MKKLWFIAVIIILLFSACDESFFMSPYLPNDEDQSRAAALDYISASHGEKRSITVSWNSVSNAVLYYIYKADSPLDTFDRCAETSATSYKFTVSPGSSVYYRVSYVLHDGTESKRSNYILGTSLAQPVISDITDISEDSAAVTWYMENVSKNPCICSPVYNEDDGSFSIICSCQNKYYKDLIYIVYCYDGTAEVSQMILEASKITENKAVFTGLTPNTRYEYQVEAYLRTNQSDSEKSDKMDAATARRFRPGPPLHLIASHGTSENEIKLSFTLPDMVDIALGDNMYDPKPLYFTISKRLYSESGNNEYQLVCAYYGTNPVNAAGKTGGKTFGNNIYSPGEIITWEDSGSSVRRGVEYEYRVQSYVDNTTKLISSDSSRSSTTGWALSSGEVSYGETKYSYNSDKTLYNAAELPIRFNFDPKDISYEYTVKITVEPLGDGDPREPSETFPVENKFDKYEDVKDYLIEMDLTQKSSKSKLGRGIYSVEIAVGIPSEQNPISVFKALGKKDISENTKPIVVNNFSVQDGYKDKFVLSWDNYPNIKYLIQESSDGTTWPADSEGVVINSTPSNDEEAEPDKSFSKEITGQDQDITKYFRIRPARFVEGGDKWGQWVYTTKGSETLGVPKLTVLEEASYSIITPVWTDTQKADTYRVKYRYTADGANAAYKTAAEKHINDLSLDATGKYRFTFKPDGYNDVSKAGNEIQIIVEALNKGLQEKVGGGEISTTSKEDVKKRLVGPALLDPKATKAVSTQEIEVSWNSIAGAGGYYVFRRQFNMNNTAEDGTESVVYYVPAVTSDIKVTGKNLTTDASNSKIDTQTVKASASFANSRYTLKDIFMNDNEYNGAYRFHAQVYLDQQNDMVQGMSYRYFIVPVISRANVIDSLNVIEFNYNKDGSNKNTNIVSYKIDESGAGAVTYTGAAAFEQEGFLIGFGQNVTATKGTYASSGNVNNGIRITWSAPPRLSTVAGFTPKYTIYRRTSGSSSWSSVTSVDATSYVDTPERGVAYEYLVGISNAGIGSVSQPQSYSRFIESCSNKRSQRNSPDMLGYMLDYVKMDSVTRGEDSNLNAQFGEKVKWYNSDITNSYNNGNNTWSIDGFEVFVMNRNIDANWHAISSMTNIPNQISQEVVLTPNNTGSVNNTVGISRNLLFVLRDYKHFFKVRSFVLNGDERIYSPDPPYTYTNGTTSNPYFLETDYVKWGARQVTDLEFAKIVTIYLAEAFRMSNYWALNTTWLATATASTNYGGGGSFRHRHTDIGGTSMHIEYSNWKQNMQTRVGDWVTFLKIDGKIWASNTHSQWPTAYGRHVGGGDSTKTHDGRLLITGPSDTPNLYSGYMHFGGDGTTDMTWSAGQVHLYYPASAAKRTVTLRGQDSAMPFQSDKNHRVTYDAWR